MNSLEKIDEKTTEQHLRGPEYHLTRDRYIFNHFFAEPGIWQILIKYNGIALKLSSDFPFKGRVVSSMKKKISISQDSIRT